MPTVGLQLDERMQRVAVNIVVDDFTTAKDARDQRDYGTDGKGIKYDFDKWYKAITNLYLGRREAKTIPWKFCSNRSLMIGMAIIETLHARLLPAVYNEELTHWRPAKQVTKEKAERVERLMFWWIRVRSRMREFFDRWVRYTISYGGTLTETSWEVRRVDKGRTTAPQLMMGADGMPTQIPGEKILDREEKTRSDIIPIDDTFLLPGSTDIQKDPVCIRVRYLYRDLEEMEREGKAINVTKPSFPNGKALKDFIVISATQMEGVQEDQRDEFANIKRRNVPVECVKWYGNIDFDNDGHAEDVRLLVCPQYQLYLGGVPLSEISKRGMRPLDYTMYLPKLDEPQGLWGIGVMEQIRELVAEIDAVFNQMTDGNTLQVLRPGFYDPSGDLDAGALSLAPNKLHPVSDPQRQVYFPEFNIPTEKLILAIRLVLEFIERLTAASSYIFGKESEIVGGSGTATRTQAIVGAANERFSIPADRLREGAGRIITQHLDLVQKNLPEGMEERILGDNGDPLFQPNELSQEGISGEYDGYFLPDDAMGSKETQRQLTQLLYGVLTQNLIVASDPTKLYVITADLLKSFGKDPVAYLGPAPDMSAIMNPEDENSLVLAGEFDKVRVSVTQNHIDHLMKHQELLQDPVFLQLVPQLQQQIMMFMQQHMQQHMQIMTLISQAVGKSNKGATGGSSGEETGGVGGAPTVGSEPGVGSPQNPLAKSRQVQRAGESLLPQAS